MEFQDVPKEMSTRRSSNEPLEQPEKALDRGTNQSGADGTWSSYGDAIEEMSESASYLKMHDISEFPDQTSFTSHLPEFSPSVKAFIDKGNRKVYEQLNSSFEILPGPDFVTRHKEEFQAHSINRGFRPRSFSDKDVFSFPKGRNSRDVENFHYEETETGDILNERSPPVSPRQFHFRDHRRPAFAKTTKNRNVIEGKIEQSYRKEKLHKTTSSSSAFSSRRNHMPVTRSKSFGGKPNYPSRGSYNSMDYHGKVGGVMPSLRRQALTNAASLSLAIKNPVSYQEPTNDLNQEYRNRARKPREDKRIQRQKLGRQGTYSRKSFCKLDFIGYLPVLDIPGVDTGEVTFCSTSGCKHMRITECTWGSQNGGAKTLEFLFHPNPVPVDLDDGSFKKTKSRTNSLPDNPEDEADDEFFQKFKDLESYWNRRHSSPLFHSPCSPTSPRPSIWQPSNDENLSPFSFYLSNSAPCTPCHTPVSLKAPCSFSDLANTESTSPTIYGGDGSGFFQNVGMLRKLEDIPQHHRDVKRYVSDPPGCSTWHPLDSALVSPLSQDLESGKHFSYDGN